MLESGKRRTKDGRTLVEAWADAVLADPAAGFAYVNEYILMKDAQPTDNTQLTSIQNLYLTAVQQASKMPAPSIEHDDEW
jgi:hypothetical protein